MKNMLTWISIILLLAFSMAQALPVDITVDEKLFDETVNPDFLSGYVTMDLSDSTLTIFLQNTSGDGAGSAAGILLTGIAFTLPGGVSIGGGSADMGASDAIGFTKPADGDVSEEWGYDSPPLNSGHFIDLGIYTYNTAVSCMVADTTDQFEAGSIGMPANFDGPDFGLLSMYEDTITDPLGNGVEAILDSLLITLNLAGEIPGNLVDLIERSPVALSFGSPGVDNKVPDGGVTVLMLGAGLLGLGALRRIFG